MKISDINRELYRDDIARVKKEIVMFRNMLKKEIIKEDGVYFSAYKDEVRIKVSYYYYPDKISIDSEIKLDNVSDVNILMDNIIAKLRDKYCVDFKYKKIRIYPKFKYSDIIDSIPYILLIGVIGFIICSPIIIFAFDVKYFSYFAYSLIMLWGLYFVLMTAYCFIYKRWLS